MFGSKMMSSAGILTVLRECRRLYCKWLLLKVVTLAFLVECHNNDGRTVLATQDSLAPNMFLTPSFIEIEFTMGHTAAPDSGLEIMKLCNRSLGTRDGSLARLLWAIHREPHGRDTIDHPLVHVDVLTKPLATCCRATDRATLWESPSSDEAPKLGRAGNVGAFPDVYEATLAESSTQDQQGGTPLEKLGRHPRRLSATAAAILAI